MVVMFLYHQTSELRSMSGPSNLEVVDEPNLLLTTIGAEADATATENEICKLYQIGILIDELLDAVPI